MGLKSWLQGHGWDGTQGPLAQERHRQAMHAEVDAWNARWEERPGGAHSPDALRQLKTDLTHAMQHIVQDFQTRAGEQRTQAIVRRESYEHAERERGREEGMGW